MLRGHKPHLNDVQRASIRLISSWLLRWGVCLLVSIWGEDSSSLEFFCSGRNVDLVVVES